MSDRDRQGSKGAGTAAPDAESELTADEQLSDRQTDPKILAERLDPALNALTAVANSVSQALKKIKTP